jgi:hypothetical protein
LSEFSRVGFQKGIAVLALIRKLRAAVLAVGERTKMLFSKDSRDGLCKTDTIAVLALLRMKETAVLAL